MNRSMLKAQARDRIAHATPRPLQVGLVFVIISMLISFLSFKIVGESNSELMSEYLDAETIQSTSFTEFMEDFDFNAYYRDIERNAPSGMASFLDALLSLLSLIIGVGMIIFCLNTLRGRDATCWNLFDGFSIFVRILVLYILESIFIALWALLFVIPGVIAYYRYSQAIYLLLDHPEMSPMDCIRESSRIMRGHKWERFVLDLSFIGWFFLIGFGNGMGAAFGFPVLGMLIGIWFYPFYFLTLAAYYRNLTGDDLPNNDGWVPEV